jgi:two-component system response regulator AlgR
MTSLKLVIADDEPMALERLRLLLAEEPGVEVVAEAADGQQVLDACAAHRPDAVLLDIAMPGQDGLQAARRLAGSDPPVAVVFCTAYDAHALSAFDAAAIDYLVKPVRPERLAAALARVRTFLAGRLAAGARRRTHLSARLRGTVRLIPLEEVRYLQAEEKYVVVHHARGEDLIEE